MEADRPAGTPEVAVVVASHAREDRVRTLIDALARQTLPRDRWEAVVVHTYDPSFAASAFEEHELARAGTLRHIPLGGRPPRPSIQRNAGWRASSAPLIAFVDDDCRPTAEWLERLLDAARANPGAIVQGRTLPDPLEEDRFAHPHVRTLFIPEPPSARTETANILYERRVLEAVGGFDERAVTGEDMDLGIRARAAGALLAGAPDALAYHAVDALSLPEKIRSQLKWRHLAYVVKRNPVLREQCEYRIWWKPEHLRAAIALAALAGATRHRWMGAGVVFYLRYERWRYGPSRAGQLRAMREAPAHWVIELAELATFAAGSVRYRTVLL